MWGYGYPGCIECGELVNGELPKGSALPEAGFYTRHVGHLHDRCIDWSEEFTP